MAVLISVLLAWSAFAFGAVYPWAWAPALTGAAAIGLAGLTAGRRSSAGVPLVLSLWMLTLVGIALQLIPIPRETLDAVSPSAATILSARNLDFAARTDFPLSIEPALTARALLFAAVLALFLFGLDGRLTPTLVGPLARNILVIGGVLAVVGIVQRAFRGGPIYGFWYAPDTSNAFGPFINRNHFAGWMVMATGLGLGYLHVVLAELPAGARTWRRRLILLGRPEATRALLAIAALAAMMIATVWSISRSGIISLTVVIASTVLLQRGTQAGRASRLVAATAILLIAGAFAWRGLETLGDRFTTPDSLVTRIDAWRDTWRIVEDFPWTGTGLNTYTVATLFYQRSNEGTHLAEAHNDYLQILSDGGLLVAIPCALTIGAAAWAVWRRARQGPDIPFRAIQRGAAIGLLGITVQETVEFSLQKPANSLLFVVLLAIALHDAGRASGKSRGAGSHGEAEPRGPSSAV